VKLLKNKTSTVKDKRLQHEEFAKTKASKSITHVCGIVQLPSVNKNITTNGGPQRASGHGVHSR